MDTTGMNDRRNSHGKYTCNPTAPVLHRFESLFVKVPESGCWIWIGALKNKYGHGAFKVGSRSSKVEFAHRFSWKLYVGEIPENMKVLHRCDVGCCVNPHHLFLGSSKDNAMDMVMKKRHSYGSKNASAKINDQIAYEIKQDIYSSSSALASKYGISRRTISDIKTGKRWKHVLLKDDIARLIGE